MLFYLKIGILLASINNKKGELKRSNERNWTSKDKVWKSGETEFFD